MSNRYQSTKAWGIAILLLLFMAVNFMDKIAVGLLAVPMMDELKLSPTQFGLLGSSFFWLFAVAGIAGGFAADRVRTTGLLLVMGIAWSLLQIPMALSSSLALLIGSRVLLGVAEGPAFPVAIHACYKWFPNERRDVPVAFFGQGGSIGLLVAGIVIPMITARWGWRANFYCVAVFSLIWSLLWKMFGREGQVGTSGIDGGVESVRTPVAYAKLFREPTILACFVLHFVAYWGLALSLTWLPAYLQSGLEYSSAQSGRIYALVVTLSLPFSVGVAWLVRRMLARGISSRNARGRLSACLLLLGGGAFLSLYLFQFPSMWKIGLVVLATGVPPVIYTLVPAMLGEVVPAPQRGAILAVDNSIASVAGALAPVITGYFVQGMSGGVGYETGFAVCGTLMLGGAIFGMFLVNPGKAMRSLNDQGSEGSRAVAGSRSAVSN